MNLEDVKPIELEDNIHLLYNDSIVCPYCEYKSEADCEDNDNFEESRIIYCPQCGKNFSMTPNITITYDTDFLENDYIYQKESIEKNINRNIDSDEWYVNCLKNELDELNKKFQEYFDENQRCEYIEGK